MIPGNTTGDACFHASAPSLGFMRTAEVLKRFRWLCAERRSYISFVSLKLLYSNAPFN